MQKWGVAFLLFFADQLSKQLTVYMLPLGRSIFLGEWGGIALSLTHTVNTGMAWGLFAHFQSTLLFLRVFFVIALFLVLCFGSVPSGWRFPLLLILTGAVGNIVDTVLLGHVIDMIHLRFWGYHYPVFNIADSTIFVGVFWLFFAKREPCSQGVAR